jgi:hypothetical protein
LWHSDNDTLLIKAEHGETKNYLTSITAEVRLRRHWIGQQCAGALHPTPFKVAQPFPQKAVTKEAILAAEGAG